MYGVGREEIVKKESVIIKECGKLKRWRGGYTLKVEKQDLQNLVVLLLGGDNKFYRSM